MPVSCPPFCREERTAAGTEQEMEVFDRERYDGKKRAGGMNACRWLAGMDGKGFDAAMDGGAGRPRHQAHGRAAAARGCECRAERSTPKRRPRTRGRAGVTAGRQRNLTARGRLSRGLPSCPPGRAKGQVMKRVAGSSGQCISYHNAEHGLAGAVGMSARPRAGQVVPRVARACAR